MHRHGPERCLRYAEAVTFRKNVRNRAGWVRKAIENGYELDVPDAVSGTVSDTKAATPTPGREPGGDTVASTRAAGPDAGSAPVGPQMSLAIDSENPGEDGQGDGQGSSVGDQTPPPPLQSDPAAEEAWRQVVSDIEERIDVSSLRVWFKQSFGTDLEGRTLSVAVPNTFAKEYIETRFGGVLTQAAASRLGEGARVEVVVGQRAAETAGQRA